MASLHQGVEDDSVPAFLTENTIVIDFGNDTGKIQ
jgi:hypothetical protein